MMVIHFPAALLPLDFILLCAAIYFNNDKLAEAAYYCLMCGVIGGWMAVLTGVYDFFIHLMIPGSKAIKPGLIHSSIQTIMIIGFTIVLGIEYKNPALVYEQPIGLWIAKIVLLIMLLAGNYFGGDLVLRYVSKQFRSFESS